MWLVQKIWFSERIDIENQAGSWPWRWNTSLTKRRKLFKPQVWNYGRIYSKLNQKETPKIPRGCGLFSLATWVPSVPSGSSRWPTTVGVLVRLRRCPVPPLDRALFSLATSTARRRSKLFSLAEHDRTLRYRCPRFRPIFSRLSASSSRLPGPPVWKWSHPTTKTTTTRTRASRSVSLNPYPFRAVDRVSCPSDSIGCARVVFWTVLFVGTGREKLNFSRHSSGRSWWRHPGSR